MLVFPTVVGEAAGAVDHEAHRDLPDAAVPAGPGIAEKTDRETQPRCHRPQKALIAGDDLDVAQTGHRRSAQQIRGERIPRLAVGRMAAVYVGNQGSEVPVRARRIA